MLSVKRSRPGMLYGFVTGTPVFAVAAPGAPDALEPGASTPDPIVTAPTRARSAERAARDIQRRRGVIFRGAELSGSAIGGPDTALAATSMTFSELPV